MLDRGGQVLIQSTDPVGGAPDVALPAAGRAHLVVGVANWCNDPPAGPVSIGLTLPDGTPIVAQPGSGLTFEPPPCNGPGLPPTISVQPESWTISG